MQRRVGRGPQNRDGSRWKSWKENWRLEAIGGVTTFFTMAYIVVVNPSILGAPETGMPFSGAMTATVLLCFSMSLLMGLYADLPYAVAPGMGINAFFAFTLIVGKQIPWQTALGIVFWAGVLFVLVSVTPLRVRIAEAIPVGLRHATAAGMGAFLCFIGLKNMGFIVADPQTLVRLGTLTPQTMLALASALLIVVLLRNRNPFAFLSGIISVTVLAWCFGWVKLSGPIFAKPDFDSAFLQLDVWGALKLSLWPSILSLLFTDLFDSVSTFVGVSHATGLVDKKGQPLRMKEGLLVDAYATLTAGLFGTSSGTAYIESSAGIEVGARTGFAAVVTALCFLPCFFLAPLASAVPDYATAPVLILVGSMMFRSIEGIRWKRIEDSLPAFLTILLIPLTFSITQGILWGFVSHVVLYTLTGRRRELPHILILIALLSVVLLLVEHGQA